MTDLSRRMLICGAAAFGVRPALTANKQEAHRFRTPEFDIEMTVEFHDGYTSRGFWFREESLNRDYCLSAEGQEGRNCLAGFRGSLAIARYRIRQQSGGRAAPTLREYVRTIDSDARLGFRPPFERTIRLEQGVASDLQVFGYEAAPGDEAVSETHGPWRLYRQDLFLGRQGKPFLAIFWKHALTAIRVLDVIPGEQTWPGTK